eukprot:CAMPEP_0168854888 /NCGR_PEP_ID=MMETSP0727-20121128/14333_1 /TAXON_ID=265536 /ORGANISM="Amphiprora sp., Strain CCMP467" /LENGTH=69 /DNA_ID=CAMNT_0008909273 /DNA_START=370 /DNA_END=576 /DNA_ORIENTATION=-
MAERSRGGGRETTVQPVVIIVGERGLDEESQEDETQGAVPVQAHGGAIAAAAIVIVSIVIVHANLNGLS